MQEYQVSKYFEWGSLNLEPLQYIEVSQGEAEDCLVVIQSHTQKKITVSKKAFERLLKLGTIVTT